jgi:DNA repair exonuclease SbcCD nuclease subunit
LEFHPNIHIFTKPCSFFYSKNALAIKITGFPYIRHNAKEKFQSIIKKAELDLIDPPVEKADYNILFMHQLVQGSKVEHYTFNEGHNVIQFEELPRLFDLILTGHVHRFQYIFMNKSGIKSCHSIPYAEKSGEEPIWRFKSKSKTLVSQPFTPLICYSGTSEKVSMMERNEKKGYIIGKISETIHNGKKTVMTNLNHVSVPSITMKYLIWDLKVKTAEDYAKETYKLIQEMTTTSESSSLKGIIRIVVIHSEPSISPLLKDLRTHAKIKRILLNATIRPN